MTNSLRISHPTGKINGSIKLSGSKSLSNRALVIQHLCESAFTIDHLSTSDDTQTLEKLLKNSEATLDAHHAGTTFRFMTALLALGGSERVLTGSDRMKQRPIAPLVDALRQLGADIAYIEKEGFPPLKFGAFDYSGSFEITINGSVSSQYITALLLIAPVLPDGLILHIEGDLVSIPYVEMTLSMLSYFGISYTWQENTITIPPQAYQGRDIMIEGDWSSASYFFSMAAIAKECNIEVHHLQKDSLQGDQAIVEIAEQFGVQAIFEEGLVRIIKDNDKAKEIVEYDFIRVPDLAQTVFVMAGAKGISGVFSGLQTLKIKETDRIEAMKQELKKYGVFLSKLPKHFSSKDDDFYLLEGKCSESTASIATYNDHRMALAFAPLALLFPLYIEHHDVVSKSYPNYWNDLQLLGFTIEK